MGPTQNPSSSPPEKQCLRKPSPPKRRARRPRSRRCLLKGCESIFRPRNPLARYSCSACREAARQWRKWKAQQRYRKSPNGRQKRQAQSHRNRDRHKTAGSTRKTTCSCAARVIPIGFFSCDRPGCYQVFQRTTRSPRQRFCSLACRLALERVLKRERHWLKASRKRKFPKKEPRFSGRGSPPISFQRIEHPSATSVESATHSHREKPRA